MLIQVAAQRIQAIGPEFLVTGQPHGGLLHGLRQQGQVDDPPVLGTGHQPRGFQHAQVLHEPGQGHAMRLCQLTHRKASLLQGLQHFAARRVGQRGKHGVEYIVYIVLILNHMD